MTDTQPDDAEMRRLRALRFGTLPARVLPDAAVESVATGIVRGLPDDIGSEERRQVIYAGG